MSHTRLDPALPRDARISLSEAHRPALKDGDYRLTHRLRVGGINVSADFKAPAPVEFSVAGPRTALEPGDIHSTFPPDLARGDFSRGLPHIALRRATLPWERSALSGEAADPPPWMALLVLDPDEIKSVETVPASEALRRVGLAPETADAAGAGPEAQARLLTLTERVARLHLPHKESLALSAHARVAETGKTRTETSVVVASRRPRSVRGETVRSVLHLVSVEARFAEGASEIALSGDVTLISLATWDILNEAPLHGFLELLEPIADRDGPKRLGQTPPDAVAEVPAALMTAGWVPVPLHMRDGSKTLSWYHGPLVGDAAVLPDVALPHPAATADALNVVMPAQGMTDISYAAAWQLGRGLILSRPQIARDLAQWKRADRAASLAARAKADHAHLPHGIRPPKPPQLGSVAAFLRDDLAGLKAVPFRYLVPDERLLPLESLRFFDVDPNWLRCLMDGAFSVGRASSGDLTRDAERTHLLPAPVAQSGFLLRSAVVSAFPGLICEGYQAPIAQKQSLAPAGQRALGIVRAERLGPNTLMVLFDGPLRTLDLHLHPQAMHFSLPEGIGPEPGARVDFSALATQLGLTGDSHNSAVLARTLLQGMPLVRITRETPR